MRISSVLIATLSLFLFFGCALTPNIPAKQALKESVSQNFDAKGYNYSSTFKINTIKLPPKEVDENQTATDALTQMYMDKGIAVLKGLNLQLRGATDMRIPKSEATYDLKYSQNNVDISFKFPVLIDYSKPSVYIGNSFINTVFPRSAEDEGKLIRIDLNDSIIEVLSSTNPMFKDMTSPEHVKKMQRIVKESLVEAIMDVNDSSIYDVALRSDDQAAVDRRIDMKLDNNGSIRFLVKSVDGIAHRLFEENYLTKEQLGAYLILSDPKQIEAFNDKIAVETLFQFALSSKNELLDVIITVHISDKEKSFELGMEGETSFSNYNEPVFTLDPLKEGSIDYKEIFKNFSPLFPSSDDSNGSEDDLFSPEEPAIAEPALPAEPFNSSEQR